MSWAALASNQMVSRGNLQNAVDTGQLVLKSTITGDSNRMCTKSDVETFIDIDTGNGTWAGYASNRLVPKSAITAAKNTVSYVYITDGLYSDGYQYCQSNICGNSGNYYYQINQLYAELRNASGAVMTNNTGTTIYVNFDADAAGCYNGPTSYSIAIVPGASSGVAQYYYTLVDNCGDGDTFCCTTNNIFINCVSSITNNYSIYGGSAYGYCGSPGGGLE